MTTQPTLILASGSKRRQQFLHELGLRYHVVVADIDETPLPDEHPAAMTRRLAEEKAQAVAARLPADPHPRLIIASDTTVARGDTVYGKPIDADDAVRMLAELRDGPHVVLSAITLLHLPDGRQATHVNSTTVVMRDYTDAEIRAYVDTGDPLDKAGAYGIQARDFNPVASLQGCYAGVMGLPLADLGELLVEFGVPLPVPAASSLPALLHLRLLRQPP